MAWELKDVRLVGFKSFSRRTKVNLGSGLTAIVGSNGCGKTNIADAVRYALGEMRPHQLRVENLEDIIFAGTANTAPVVVAEVTMTFTEALLNEEFTVTRRLARGGDTEYRIDGQLARLKDVQRKLEQIGIVSHRGVVVELRHMDEVLIEGSKLPRQMIEEGCGIAPFLEKRNQAQNRLNEALKSLELLEPRIAQINVELERLAQQSQKAKRWRNTREALDRARNAEQWGEVRKLRKDLTELNLTLDQLKSDTSIELEYATLQTQLSEAEIALTKIQLEWDQNSDEMFSIGNTRESITHRLKELELRKVKLETQTESNQAELARVVQELADNQTDPTTTLYDDLAEAIKVYDLTAAKITDAEQYLAKLQEQHRENAILLSNYLDQKNRIDRQVADSATKQKRLTEQLSALEPFPIPDATIGQQHEQKIGELRQSESDLLHQLETTQKSLTATEDTNRQISQKILEATAEHNRVSREITWAERMMAERPDLTKQLRAFLSNHQGSVKLIRDEGESHAALLYQIAGADRVVTTPENVAKILKDALSQKVRIELSIEGVTKIVSLDALLTENPPAGEEWVAMEGASRDSSGIIRIAGDEKSSVPIGLPKQLAQLKSNLNGIKETETQLNSEQTAIQSQLQTIRDSFRLLTDQKRKVVDERTATERLLMQFHASVAEVTTRNSFRVAERERVLLQIAEAQKEEAELVAAVAKLEQPAVVDLTEQITEATLNSKQIKLLADDQNRTVQRLRIELRNFEMMKEQRKHKITTLEQRKRDAETKHSEFQTELELIGKQWQSTKAEYSQYDDLEKSLSTKRTEINLQRKSATTVLSDTRTAYEAARTKQEEWRTQCVVLNEKVTQISQNLSEKERLAAETGPEPKETVRVGAEEILRLEQRLRSLEPVNHLAEQEFDTLKSEVDFLLKEREQIREAAGIHGQSVDEAVKFAVEKLTVARVQIEQVFTNIIARLFPGGEATLEWGEGDILTDAPLLLKVSPRGKRIRSLRILSGGERALVALAFLVSVLSQNRSLPFMVLDEVDAPLDEENTVRFLNWLKDLTATTQVILLTHNRRSIAASDSWVGVSMPEPGISQVVKVIPTMEET